MSRFLPASATLVSVTALLAAFGSSRWSWLAGPVATLAIWALDREEPSLPLAADPEPVD